MKRTFLSALAVCICSAAFASSNITTRPDDPKAVYVRPPAADADSSDVLQAAIDKAEGSAREGIVFIPAGHYTLTRTIYVWPGVRLMALLQTSGLDGGAKGCATPEVKQVGV